MGPGTKKDPLADEGPASGRGLTVGALLLIAIGLGLLGAFLGPLHLKARDLAAQRRTMADIRVWAKALSAYIADHGAAPPNPNGEINFKKPLTRELVPYLVRVRTNDWFNNKYLIWTGPGQEEYGLSLASSADFLIVSKGKGGVRENWRYDPAHPEAGLFAGRGSADFEHDLVFWNGRPIRWPRDRQ